MNEEIRKNVEINDDELEQVSGGNAYLEAHAPNCPNCGVKMRLLAFQALYYYFCDTCYHKIDIEP